MFNGVTAPFVRVEYDAALPLGPKDPSLCDWTLIPTELVRSLSIRRGKTQENQVVQPGDCTIVFDNRSGDFDPMNSASPYWIDLIPSLGGYSYFSPNMGVRVVATWDEVDYVLYTGFLEQLEMDYGLNPTVTVTFVDVMAYLAKRDIAAIPATNGATPPVAIPAVGNGDPVYFRCDRILDQISFPAGLRGLDTSVDNTLYGTRFGQDALSLLQTTVDCGPARLFADVDGVLRVLRWDGGDDAGLVLSDDTTDPDVVGYDSIDVDPGAKYLLNTVTINKIDGDGENRGVVVRSDSTSVFKFGIYQATYDLPTNTAAPVAEQLATQYATPIDRVKHISFPMTNLGANFVKVLSSDLADAVSVERTTFDGRSLAFTCAIEGIDHDITPESWRAGFTCSTESVVPVVEGYWFGALGFTGEGPYFDYVDVDSADNLYSVGNTSGGFVLAKTNTNGVLQWQQKVSTDDLYALVGLKCVGDYVYVAFSANGLSDKYTYILKFNTYGDIVWQVGLDGPYAAVAMTADSSGVYIVTLGTVNKVDPSGAVLWSQYIYTYAALWDSVTIDPSGNLIVVGYTRETSSSGFYTGVFKFNASGTLVWQKQVAGGYLPQSTGVVCDSSGSLFVGIQTGSTPGCFIYKLDSSGNAVWAKQYEDGSGLDVHFTAIDSSGNLYGTSSNNLSKFSASGDLVYQHGLDFVTGIAIDSNNDMCVSGFDLNCGFFGRIPNDGSKLGSYEIVGPSSVFVDYVASGGSSAMSITPSIGTAALTPDVVTVTSAPSSWATSFAFLYYSNVYI